jgi:solute carrier family 25 (adenine nucleotide translocator) protein 4/5/6/31
MTDVVTSIVKTDGVTGIYKGFGVAVFGSVVFRGLHMGLYDFAKSDLKPEQTTFWKRFAIAQAISMFAGTLCYPFDSVRRRLMMQAGGETQYNSAISCCRHVVKHEGFRGFFLGLTPNLFRSVGGAVLLVSYDEFKSAFTNVRNNRNS